MTEEKTLQILAMLQTAYPGFYRGMTRQQLTDARKLWMFHFGGHDYNTVFAAVNRLIATRIETWPPTIGEVNEEIYKMKHPEPLTPADAWSMVRKAISRSAYYSEEEWGKLPEDVQRAVRPAQLREWAVDEDFNEGVASSNFMKTFRETQSREKEDSMIPRQVRYLISQAAEKMKLEGE